MDNPTVGGVCFKKNKQFDQEVLIELVAEALTILQGLANL